jgi:hypothetical protein
MEVEFVRKLHQQGRDESRQVWWYKGVGLDAAPDKNEALGQGTRDKSTQNWGNT